MRLYWDLAMRLLWGSRLNASTRMTALLAIGILVSTAFGVIVVGMVNKGFSFILQAETIRLREAPKFTVSFGVRTKIQDDGFPAAMRKRNEAEQQFQAAWGQSLPPQWHYRMVDFLMVPEANLPDLVHGQEKLNSGTPPPLRKDATREEMVIRQAEIAQLGTARVKLFERLRLSRGTACAAPGVGPSAPDEAWVLRTWGDFGQELGSSWVGILNKGDETGAMGFHKKLRVVRLATQKMRATGCGYWISSRLMDILERRYPESVWLVMGSNEMPPSRLIDHWFDNEGKYGFDPKDIPSLWGSYDFRNPASDSSYQEMGAEKVLSVQRLVSWLVVGMMGALSIYQICSLMMMLGLHSRFDVAMLRSLGMSRSRVMVVFLLSSILIMGLGLGVGMLAAWYWLPHMNAHLQWLLGALDADDLVDWVPWVRDARFAFASFGIGMGLGLVASLVPAWMASRARPSDIWKEET